LPKKTGLMPVQPVAMTWVCRLHDLSARRFGNPSNIPMTNSRIASIAAGLTSLPGSMLPD
jgi:hypothetical protein